MSRHEYEVTKRLLQIELLKLQAWINETGQEGLSSSSRVATRRGRVGRSSGSWSTSTHAARQSWRSACRPRARRDSGTSSDRSGTCRPPGRSCCSIARGTTAPASNGSWDTAPSEQYVEFLRHVPEFERSLAGVGHDPHQAVVLGVTEGAGHSIHDPADRPGPPVETQPERSGVARPMGRLHGRQGNDVQAHRHDPRAVDRRAQQRQEAWSSRSDPLRPSQFDYPDKDHDVVGAPDPLIVGPPSVVVADAGEIRS